MSEAASSYPEALSPSYWDRKKGSLPPGSDLPDLLKALQRKHAGIDWKLFAPDWPRACKSADELQEAFARRDRVFRASVLPLKREAAGIATAAQRLGKDKAAAKPAQDAAKAIGAAAGSFSDLIDKELDGLKEALDQAAKAIPATDADDEEPGNALLDPRRLLTNLTLCRRDPERRMHFGFVDAKDKAAPAALALHPRMTGRKLFSVLQAETGVKTGAYGLAWIEEQVLVLQLEKPLGGLVKKIRAPVKACGFRIARVVIRGADGEEFERDEDAEQAEEAASGDATAAVSGTAGTPGPGDAQATAGQHEYETRHAELEPRWLAALRAPGADATRLRAVMGFAGEKAQGGQFKAALQALDMVEKLLAAAGTAPSSAGNAAQPAQPAQASAGAAQAQAPASAANVLPPSSRVALMRSRLTWDMTRREIRKELEQLERAVLEASRDEPDFAEIQANSGRIYGVLDRLDERLIDILDDALNAADAARRAALEAKALEVVRQYIEYTQTDELFRDIADNGFVTLSIPGRLQATLSDLARQLDRAPRA